MSSLSDSHPLTAFLRDHESHLERLRATARSEVLTVNGKARVVADCVSGDLPPWGSR